MKSMRRNGFRKKRTAKMLGGMNSTNSTNSMKVEKVENMYFRKEEGHYTGDIMKNKHGKPIKHGKGKIIFVYGGSYDGDWKNNEANGYGIQTFYSGETYEGEFVDDMPEGYGVYKSNSPPHTYRGHFAKGIKHGTGFLTTTCLTESGRVFGHGTVFGDFENDQFVKGTGKRCENVDNLFENGDYENGKLIKGIVIWPQGNSFEGIYDKKGNPAKGTFKWANGAKYEGEYENGRRSGFGVYTSTDGSVYEGHYKNDLKNGMGKITYPNGTVISGEFHNDRLKQPIRDRVMSSVYNELGAERNVFRTTRKSSR